MAEEYTGESVSDKNIVRIQMNDSAQVFFDAYPSGGFSAYVSEIAESADARTGAHAYRTASFC